MYYYAMITLYDSANLKMRGFLIMKPINQNSPASTVSFTGGYLNLVAQNGNTPIFTAYIDGNGVPQIEYNPVAIQQYGPREWESLISTLNNLHA